MALLTFRKRAPRPTAAAPLQALLQDFSIEVMPRTAAAVPDFRALLPAGTRVYIAHIDGTPIEEMVATAARLAGEGFAVMPHLPARSIADAATLDDWLRRYREEAGVTQALVLAGGLATPRGAYDSSLQLLQSGLFEKHGFTTLHVAGHPEGNRDIDPEGGEERVMAALRWKQGFAEGSGIAMAVATQFAFEAAPIIAWSERLRARGITLPLHVGVAGPAKLQTLIRFAVACGVGPSLRVLQKRALDVTKLVLPYEPTELLEGLAAHRAADPQSLIRRVHFFPLGGITATAGWTMAQGGVSGQPATG